MENRTPLRVIGQLAFGVYVLGVILSGAWFNWAYAKDNGFVKWLLLGQIVPSAKALVWPYYAFVRQDDDPPFQPANRSANHSSGMPRSVATFLKGVDLLARANARPTGITPEENLVRVRRLFAEAIASWRDTDRAELNRLFAGLGDAYVDHCLRHMQLMLKTIDNGDQSALAEATGSYLAWQEWWSKHSASVNERIISAYSQ